MATEIPRFRIVYYDEDRADDVIVVGQWEITLAERKYGEGAITVRQNLDAITYACYLGAKRAGVIEKDTSYEAWARTVALTDGVSAGESQAPPGT